MVTLDFMQTDTSSWMWRLIASCGPGSQFTKLPLYSEDAEADERDAAHCCELAKLEARCNEAEMELALTKAGLEVAAPSCSVIEKEETELALALAASRAEVEALRTELSKAEAATAVAVAAAEAEAAVEASAKAAEAEAVEAAKVALKARKVAKVEAAEAEAAVAVARKEAEAAEARAVVACEMASCHHKQMTSELAACEVELAELQARLEVELKKDKRPLQPSAPLLAQPAPPLAPPPLPPLPLDDGAARFLAPPPLLPTILPPAAPGPPPPSLLPLACGAGLGIGGGPGGGSGAPALPCPGAAPPTLPPKKKAEPSVPMRPLHWSKVPAAKLQGTIWLEEVMEETRAKVDLKGLEAVFGLPQGRAGRSGAAAKDPGAERERSAASVEGTKKLRKEPVQLMDTQRSNNISIALARIRMSDEGIKAAVLDPIKHELQSEQVAAILSALPTTEELEIVKEYTGDAESLGRVEKFVLALSGIERLHARLQALHTTNQFSPQHDALSAEIQIVRVATEQVLGSSALKMALRHALRLGNHLNGTSARGGAYGFKLADLSLLEQVKSADSATTLLHYLAKSLGAETASAVDDLKNQLSALPEAKDICLADKKAELAKLGVSVGHAQQQLEAGANGGADPMTPLLSAFCEGALKQLDELTDATAAAATSLAKAAGYLAEQPKASTEDIFRPLATFVKAFEKAHLDNVREVEAEQRKAKAAAGGGGAGWRAAVHAAVAKSGGQVIAISTE